MGSNRPHPREPADEIAGTFDAPIAGRPVASRVVHLESLLAEGTFAPSDEAVLLHPGERFAGEDDPRAELLRGRRRIDPRMPPDVNVEHAFTSLVTTRTRQGQGIRPPLPRLL